jgi:chlorite dismutase
MADEAHAPNGWTVYTLKSYMDRRFEDADKAVVAALSAQKEAVVKAEIATEKRFETVRQEADFRMNALASKIDGLQAAIDQNRGRAARDDRNEGRAYAQGVQSRYLGIYFTGAFILSVVGSFKIIGNPF